MSIPPSGLLVAAQIFGTFAMVGLIWFVQIVHYPMMRRFPENGFAAIAREHCERTGSVVLPLMTLELASGVMLWIVGLREPLFALSLGLLALIWLSTATLQAPLHRRLIQGKDPLVLNRLIATNWIRTVAWTLRAVCLILVFS